MEINGTDASETLNGTSSADLIITYDGADTVNAGDGNDEVNGYFDTQAKDFMYYDAKGSKTVFGGAGNDLLSGGSDADNLQGEAGNDTLQGGDGNDTLAGGEGQNILTGGAGSDTYVVSNQTTVIVDSSTDTNYAQVSAHFVKLPSYVTPTYVNGAMALPYWIDALLPNDGNGQNFASLLGDQRQYSYIFPTTLPSYIESNSSYANGFLAFTDTQKAAAKACLQYITSLVNISFVETTQVDSLRTLSFSNNHFDGRAVNPQGLPWQRLARHHRIAVELHRGRL